MKEINEWTRKEFEELPFRDSWDADIGLIGALVILPTTRKHDSGFRCLDFVAVVGNRPICRLSGCSDVIHIEGIGGFGKDWYKRYGTVPELVSPKAWSIDCLNKSGLLRLFCHDRGWSKLSVGPALSSFEVFSEEESDGG
jgi:hypothetical protein